MPIITIAGQDLLPDHPTDPQELSDRINVMRRVSRNSESAFQMPVRNEWIRWSNYARQFSYHINADSAQRAKIALQHVDLSREWALWDWDRMIQSNDDLLVTVVLCSLNAIAKINRVFDVPNLSSDKVSFLVPTRTYDRAFRWLNGTRCNGTEINNAIQIPDEALLAVRQTLSHRNWREFWEYIGVKYDSLRPLNPRAQTNQTTDIPEQMLFDILGQPTTRANMNQAAEFLESLFQDSNGSTQPTPRRIPVPRPAAPRPQPQRQATPRPATPRQAQTGATLKGEYESRVADDSMSTEMIITLLQKKGDLPGKIRDTIYELLIQDQVSCPDGPGD